MQVPSNLVMNATPKPRLFMAIVVCLWGSISALTSVIFFQHNWAYILTNVCDQLCNDFSHLVICRFFLGFVGWICLLYILR